MANRLCRSLEIPANLDLNEIIPQGKYKRTVEIKKDKLAFICNTIYYLMKEQNKNLVKQCGFVKIQSKYLKKFIPDYHLLLKYLLEKEVLLNNPSYRVHHFSKGYRFHDKYLVGVKKHCIISGKFSKHIDLLLNKMEVKKRKRAKKASQLQLWFNENLKIDKKAASLWIRDSYNAHTHAIEDAWLNNEEYNKSIEKVNARHQDYSKKLWSFNVNRYSVDRFGYRFHNALTTLNSELRNFIKYDSQKMVAFDIKTSQPYFSLLLFNPKFYYTRASKEALTLKKLNPELYQCLKHYDGLSELQKIAKNTKESVDSISDIDFYKDDIIENDFYQVIADFAPGVQSRETGKAKIFPLMFENWSRMKYDTPYIRAFREKYPTVYEVFSILKRRKYNDFAKLLQRIESNVMYSISRAFNRFYPDAPIYTIHDNFITTEAYKTQLNDLLIRMLPKYVGQKPNLSETIWKPGNAKIKIEI